VDPEALSRRAAEEAGVEIRRLEELAEIERACELFSELWAEPGGAEPVSPHLLRALELSGNYVFGAIGPEGDLVGATAAWATPGPVLDLHSHITGVVPSRQRFGVGLALKLHQRTWAIEHGFSSISWTFDPLVRRNAVFNLARLGARVVGYIENLYGTMNDAMNAGDKSDRFLLRWTLDEPTGLEEEGGARYLLGERPELLAFSPGGGPLLAEVTGQPEVSVAVPEDIEAIRRAEPPRAREWRSATCAIFSGLHDKGGEVRGLDRAGRYVVYLGRHDAA
jgi:predicted GNAT superfamily acetyltransferase